jgi:hypothetical protein
MATQPRTQSDDYRQSLRLLAAAESSRTAEIQIADALIGIGYAILASSGRRARRPEREHRPPTGGSPQTRWMLGQDE